MPIKKIKDKAEVKDKKEVEVVKETKAKVKKTTKKIVEVKDDETVKTKTKSNVVSVRFFIVRDNLKKFQKYSKENDNITLTQFLNSLIEEKLK